jgi:high affinity sulfate transporter 1
MEGGSTRRHGFGKAFVADLIPGLTTSAVVVPKALAYATIAQLPVQAGLFAALVPMVVYAALGTSRLLSVSTTTPIAILCATAIGTALRDNPGLDPLTAAATLSVLVGLMLIAARILRFGFLANFISESVLTGFKAGVGFVIVVDQLPKLLGIHITKEGFFRDILSIVHHLPETSMISLGLAVATLGILTVMERLWRHSPAPLIAVAGGIAVSWLFGLNAMGVATVGLIPQGLPSLTLPDLALVEQLLPGALGIALMSFTETIAAGRAFAAPSDPPIQANRDLIATGAANLGGALLGAMPAGGGTSQTAVVRAVGGQSQKASMVTAAAAAATMLLLAPMLGLLPQAVLAAVVIIYSVGLIQPAEFAAISKVRKMEFGWALAAFAGVLIFGTLKGILVAIILSLVGLASQASNPKVYVMGRKRGTDVLRPLSPEHPDDETFPGLLILRPEGRLFFVNVQLVAERVRDEVAKYKPRVLILDMNGVFDIEYSALQMLMEREHHAASIGVTLWLSDLTPAVLDYIRASGFADYLGRERLFFNTQAAIRHYQENLAAAKLGAAE